MLWAWISWMGQPQRICLGPGSQTGYRRNCLRQLHRFDGNLNHQPETNTCHLPFQKNVLSVLSYCMFSRDPFLLNWDDINRCIIPKTWPKENQFISPCFFVSYTWGWNQALVLCYQWPGPHLPQRGREGRAPRCWRSCDGRGSKEV